MSSISALTLNCNIHRAVCFLLEACSDAQTSRRPHAHAVPRRLSSSRAQGLKLFQCQRRTCHPISPLRFVPLASSRDRHPGLVLESELLLTALQSPALNCALRFPSCDAASCCKSVRFVRRRRGQQVSNRTRETDAFDSL